MLVIGLNGFSQNLKSPQIKGPNDTEVNLYTGNLFYQRSDLYLPGIGLDLELDFTYNSTRTQIDIGYGAGWSFKYAMYYFKDTSGVNVVRGNGHKDKFTPNDQSYLSPPGIFETLEEYEEGKFVLTLKNGRRYFFDDSTHKKLTRIVDLNDNSISLSYSGDELSSLTTTGGRTVTLEWEEGHLRQLIDINSTPARVFHYVYSGNLLTSMTDPMGNSERYAYNLVSQITSIINKNGEPLDITYDATGRVAKLIPCGSDLFRFSYISNKTYFTRALPEGNQTYIYNFDEVGRNISVTDPMYNQESFEYDENVSLENNVETKVQKLQ